MNKSFNASLQLLYLFASSIAFATEVVVDGSLNDSGWQSAKRNTVNYQVVPQTLTKVESNFSYQIITTDHGIYIAVVATTKQPLRVRTQENDSLFTNDHIQLMIDMNNTEQTSYVFSVNHQGYY